MASIGRKKRGLRVLKRRVFGICFICLLVCMAVSSVNVVSVKADGVVLATILPNGDIDPSTAPIQRNGDVYLLKENVTLGYVDTLCIIRKSNIVIDGNGFEIQGAGASTGFYLDGGLYSGYYTFNVTFRHLIMKSVGQCIDATAEYVRGTTVVDSYFSTPWYLNLGYWQGITGWVNASDNEFVGLGSLGGWEMWNCVIARNKFSNGSAYLSLTNSPNSTIFENEGLSQLSLSNSPNSIISNNTMANPNGDIGISVSSSENVTIAGNTATGLTSTSTGIGLGASPACLISKNRFSSSNHAGICMYIGQSCDGTRISDNFLMGSQNGIRLASNCTLTGNVISNNTMGVVIDVSWFSWPYYGFPYSKIFHNHFINNTVQAYWGMGGLPYYPANVTTWDDGYPSGGNYWSDYVGVDLNYDGIGDSPQSLKINPGWPYQPTYMGRDRFPLMRSPFAPGPSILQAFFNYTVSPDYEAVFDGSLSYASKSTIVSYDWDFGDGTTATGMVVTHKYSKGGGALSTSGISASLAEPAYAVKLKIKDNKGSTSNVARTVTRGNLKAVAISPAQVFVHDNYYSPVPLVYYKATDFQITYESTFCTDMEASVRVEAPGFIPDLYEFKYRFAPGTHHFVIGQDVLMSQLFWPIDKPVARFKFTIDPGNTTPETDETDNCAPATGFEEQTVNATKGLRVLFVPVRFKDEDGYPGMFTGYSRASFVEHAVASVDYIKATYPVAESGWGPGSMSVSYDCSCFNSAVTVTANGEEQERPTTKDKANEVFANLIVQLAAKAGSYYDRVVGVVRTDWFDGIPGYDGSNGFAIPWINPMSCVVTLGNWATTAHEIGHTYGLADSVKVDNAGYYVMGRTSVYANTWMSTSALAPKYRLPVPAFWIGRPDYRTLVTQMIDPTDPEMLFFSAKFWRNGTAELGSWYRYAEGFPTNSGGKTGNYSIVQLDGSNNILSVVGFNVTFENIVPEHPDLAFDMVPVAFTIPYSNGATMIQVRDQLGNVVASRAVSDNPPSVHVTSPNGGEILKSDQTQISWEASDLDGDALTYNLLVSGDGGSTWDPVATGLSQTTHNLILTGFSGGDRYLVKVVASDGVNTAEDTSDGFFTIASFTATLVSVPQATQAGGAGFYLLNITSYGGFSDPITLNASSSTTNQLKFIWDGGATVTPVINGSTYVLLEVQTLDQIQTGNHTIYLSGTCGSNTEVAVSHLFVFTHDLAVTNIIPSETTVLVGSSVNITVTIENQGSFGEAFDVYVYGNGDYISDQSAYVPVLVFVNLTFTWDTAGFRAGNYILSAEITQVEGEIDIADNVLTLTAQPVTVEPIDSTPPATTDNYSGLWQTSGFTITLTPTDNVGVKETYYRINNGPTQSVSANGQPRITTEGANHKLEYWSVDNADNEELPHKILTGIKLDKTTPIGSITIAQGASYAASSSVILSLSATDATSGLAQMRFSNDNVTWSGWEAYVASKSWTLLEGDGVKSVTVQYKDNAGLISLSYSDSIILDTAKPTANAGADQTVNEDNMVTFDASASTDENGIATYTWTFTDASTVQTLDGINPTYNFQTPGTYAVTLNVIDAAGNYANDTVTLTILDITKPVANAGQDQTVNVETTVSFDGRGSTDNVGIASYNWSFGDGTSGTGGTTTHAYASPGTYTATLTVEDAAGNMATDTITVTVHSGEAPPPPPTEAFSMWMVVAAAAIIAIAGAVAIFLRRRK